MLLVLTRSLKSAFAPYRASNESVWPRDRFRLVSMSVMALRVERVVGREVIGHERGK